jgi:hypothetical protein
MRPPWLTALAALALGAPTSACVDDPLADDLETSTSALIGAPGPLADYELSDGITVSRLVIAVDGAPYHRVGSFRLTKAPYSLDATLDPAVLGITGVAPVWLTGRHEGGDLLRLTGTVSPPPGQSVLYYDGQTAVYRLDVDLALRGEWIDPARQGDCRWTGCTNVRLVAQPTARVVAAIGYEVVPGIGATEVRRTVNATVIALDNTTGLRHPLATRISLAGARPTASGVRLCASDRARTVSGVVDVDSPGREFGVSVPMVSSTAAVAVSAATVAPAASAGTFRLTIPAGYTGATTLSANDGSWRQLAVEIATCAPATTPQWPEELLAAPDLTIVPRPGCLACALADRNAAGQAAILSASGVRIYDPAIGAWKQVALPTELAVDHLDVDELGHVVIGGLDVNGKPRAALAEFASTGLAVRALGDFAPRVSAGALIAGGATSGSAAWTARFGTVLASPALSAAGGRIVGAAGSAFAIDVAGSDVLVDALAETTKPLGTAAEKVAVTGSAGDRWLIGTALVGGKPRGFLYDAALGVRTSLGVLSGATDSTPHAVNAAGWVVGTSGGRAFVYRPGAGLAELSSLVKSTSGVTVRDALSISDSGDVLFAGVRGQTAALFTLSLAQ